METAVGVFATRERAEEAVKSLLEHHVPQERIIYLTRSESEAKSIEKQIEAYAGGFVGGAARSAAVAAATLLAIQASVRSLPWVSALPLVWVGWCRDSCRNRSSTYPGLVHRKTWPFSGES